MQTLVGAGLERGVKEIPKMRAIGENKAGVSAWHAAEHDG
jgi:hypothetical protein